jgi:feruloyl esterase
MLSTVAPGSVSRRSRRRNEQEVVGVMAMRTSATVLGAIAIGWIATANAQDACAKLKSLKLPDTTITEAQAVEAADVQIPAPPGKPELARHIAVPAHCRIEGSIKPTTDSDIRFEALLPSSNWSHRYEQVGNGGLAGSIVRPARLRCSVATPRRARMTATAVKFGTPVGLSVIRRR